MGTVVIGIRDTSATMSWLSRRVDSIESYLVRSQLN